MLARRSYFIQNLPAKTGGRGTHSCGSRARKIGVSVHTEEISSTAVLRMAIFAMLNRAAMATATLFRAARIRAVI